MDADRFDPALGEDPSAESHVRGYTSLSRRAQEEELASLVRRAKGQRRQQAAASVVEPANRPTQTLAEFRAAHPDALSPAGGMFLDCLLLQGAERTPRRGARRLMGPPPADRPYDRFRDQR